MKCSNETHCEAMQLAIDSKGVETALLFNMKTSTSKTGVGVRVQKDPKVKKKQLLFFSTCPWCSERIEP